MITRVKTFSNVTGLGRNFFFPDGNRPHVIHFYSINDENSHTRVTLHLIRISIADFYVVHVATSHPITV